MFKRVAAVLLLGAMVLSGCSSGAKNVTVTEDKPAEVTGPPVSETPPDPSRKVQKMTMLTMTPEYSRDRYEAAFLIQKALAQLGVEFEVKPMDQKVVLDQIRSQPWDFDAYFMGWGGTPDRIDPQTFTYSMMHSSEAKHLGNNRQGYASAEYDRIADAGKRAMDPEERKKHIFEAQKKAAEDVPIVPLYFNDEYNAYNKERLEGVVNQGGIGLWNALTFINVKVTSGENILKIAHRQDNDVLNPMSPSIFTDAQVLSLLYDNLARLDAQNKPYPAAAESWTVVNDTTIDVKLKPNQKWHDGKPLTVEDVKFTFDFGLKNGFGKIDTYIRPVKQVDILDQNTVRFTLNEPTGSFISATLVGIPLLPKHIWENQADPTKWNNPNPIGSGPFKFTHWRKGEEIRLDKHADYYTPAKIDAIIQIPYANPDALLGALELKKVDLINPPLTPQQNELAKKIPHITVTKTPGVGWTYFGYNHRRPPFDDVAFRKAMAHVIDYKMITETVFGEYATPAGPGRIISPAVQFWYNPEVPTYEINVQKAYELLKNAGYEWDKDGKLYFPKK